MNHPFFILALICEEYQDIHNYITLMLFANYEHTHSKIDVPPYRHSHTPALLL